MYLTAFEKDSVSIKQTLSPETDGAWTRFDFHGAEYDTLTIFHTGPLFIPSNDHLMWLTMLDLDLGHRIEALSCNS
jgi:hypothetical protein